MGTAAPVLAADAPGAQAESADRPGNIQQHRVTELLFEIRWTI